MFIEKGADTFKGITFRVGASDTLREKLAGDALRQARRKAEVLAAAANVKLGRLLAIERPDTAVSPRVNRALDLAGGSSMPVASGTQTLSEEVEATYAID